MVDKTKPRLPETAIERMRTRLKTVTRKATTPLVTVEEFEKLLAAPENSDRLLELIDGKVVEKMPSERHGEIVLNIGTAIRNYIKPLKLGRAGVEVRHGIPKDRYNDRIPDVSFNRDNERPVVEKGSVSHMPDLAVEVKSHDDKVAALKNKAKYYLANGSKLVWIVYPVSEKVEVWKLDANQEIQITTLGKEDILSGEDIIPGFTIPVSEVFEKF